MATKQQSNKDAGTYETVTDVFGRSHKSDNRYCSICKKIVYCTDDEDGQFYCSLCGCGLGD